MREWEGGGGGGEERSYFECLCEFIHPLSCQSYIQCTIKKILNFKGLWGGGESRVEWEGIIVKTKDK